MGIASRRRPRRMARSDSAGHAPGSLTSKVMIEPTSHRAGRRSDDREEGQRLASPSRASGGRRCETQIDAAMEMTRSWKSQNDFHKRLEISLTNARFPHSHSRSSSFQTRKKTEEFNHASHTKILTLLVEPQYCSSAMTGTQGDPYTYSDCFQRTHTNSHRIRSPADPRLRIGPAGQSSGWLAPA
jgi:hypothetical protein